MSRNKWKASVDEYIGRDPILSPERKATILARFRKKEQKSVRKAAALYGLGLSAALITMVFIIFQFQTRDVNLLTSPEDVSGSLQEELSALNKENEALREKLSGISIDLQLFDHSARNIISLLGNGDFDELKNRYNMEYDPEENMIQFEGYEGLDNIEGYGRVDNPTKMADYPMRFIYIDYSNDVVQVCYYFYRTTPGQEGKSSIIFGFNKDYTIRYMVNGD